MPGYSEVSERARQRVDDEMRRIVREAHEDAVQLLSENRHRLDGLAEALFQAEPLEGPEAYGQRGSSRRATTRRRLQHQPRSAPSRSEREHPAARAHVKRTKTEVESAA
jgi:Peptidase family M41